MSARFPTSSWRGCYKRALAGRDVVNGYVNQLATEARRREATGSGTPAQEVIRAGGKVSNSEAKALDRRAAVGDVLPTVGQAVDRGDPRSENADILAHKLDRLTDTQRAALAAHDNEIARQAGSTPPETFAKWLARQIQYLTDTTPDGESRQDRQRAASEFGTKHRGDGMWDLYGRLDQTRGAELRDVITRTACNLNNGETELENLLPISRAWHHRIHHKAGHSSCTPTAASNSGAPTDNSTAQSHHQHQSAESSGAIADARAFRSGSATCGPPGGDGEARFDVVRPAEGSPWPRRDRPSTSGPCS